MNKRPFALLIIVSVLISANIFKMLLGDNNLEKTRHTQYSLPADINKQAFNVPTLYSETKKSLPVQRNLFFNPVKVRALKPQNAKVTRKNSPPPLPPAGPSEEQLAKQRLNKIQLIGIANRGGKTEAFLVYNETPHSVALNDTIEDIFQVNDLTQTTITISDQKTEVRREISIQDNNSE